MGEPDVVEDDVVTEDADRARRREENKLAREMLPYLLESGWLESRRLRRSLGRDGRPVPWITYPAIDFLERRVRPEMSIFEFGSGNSTLWWAERVASVTAVEHNESWYTDISAQMPGNVELNYVDLEPGGEYSRFARNTSRLFDVIVVDGRDRVNCAVNSMGCLTDGGVILWDNTERTRYQKGFDVLGGAGFRRLEFCGPSPINTWASETSVFYRPSNCLGI